ncbi:MAG: hypothetical protein SPI35_01505 [Porphyromonas sp.]|nr:hypothetical protein [Porphyromonas sp.]
MKQNYSLVTLSLKEKEKRLAQAREARKGVRHQEVLHFLRQKARELSCN